ncbi:amino acid ABC transporter substrate-binding protein [Pseudoalteromonas sp. C8]|uniref:amino acid ABC transporter substrate-binding protein n=1 Tax=Pseudoalteromonas sp. C8 TaxID=2686345 RepID=UPI0013FDDC54|nr:amino acid ABC transporter substrate-binding protein [Pseudoalteromonas sp. C8]
MNQFIKITAQLMYLPLALLIFITDAKSATNYVVGVENIEYLPYFDGSGTNDADYYGFSEELLTLFALQYDFEFEFYTLPINRLYKEFVEHHHVDFKYPDNPQWKPSYKASFGDLNEIIYSQPTVVTKTGIASLNKNITIDECVSFATVRGFMPQSFKPLMNNENVELIETANVMELIEMLLRERVECIYISNDVLNYNIVKYFKLTRPVYFQNELPVDLQAFLLSSIDYPDVIKKFDTFLLSHKVQIQELKKEYQIKN